MQKPEILKKCLSWLTAAALSMTAMSGIIVNVPETTAFAAETGSRIRVDINKNDGRKASYTKTANNWIVDNT